MGMYTCEWCGALQRKAAICPTPNAFAGVCGTCGTYGHTSRQFRTARTSANVIDAVPYVMHLPPPAFEGAGGVRVLRPERCLPQHGGLVTHGDGCGVWAGVGANSGGQHWAGGVLASGEQHCTGGGAGGGEYHLAGDSAIRGEQCWAGGRAGVCKQQWVGGGAYSSGTGSGEWHDGGDVQESGSAASAREKATGMVHFP